MLRKALFTIILFATVWITYSTIKYFNGGDFSQVLSLYKGISAAKWGWLLLGAAVFYFFEAARYWALLRLAGFQKSLTFGLWLTFASHFAATLTPMGELLHPVLVLLMVAGGVPVSAAIAVTAVRSLYITFWICLVAFGSLRFSPEVHLPSAVSTGMAVATPALILVGLLFIALVLFPGAIFRLTERQLSRENLPGYLRSFLGGLQRTTQTLCSLGRSISPLNLFCHVSSVLTILVYAAIGYFIATEFGVLLSPLKSLAVFSNSLMIAYLAPVPGAIGVTELATSYLINPNMTSEGIGISLLLRVISWYAPIIPGGILLALAVRKKTLSEKQLSFP